MDPIFAQKWYAAAYNIFWYLTIFIPLAAAVISLVLRKWWFISILATLSVTLTYLASFESVVRKWDLRMDAATTQEQRSVVAGSDGANLVFSMMFFGPFQAIVYTLIAFLLVHWLNNQYLRRKEAAGRSSIPTAAEHQKITDAETNT